MCYPPQFFHEITMKTSAAIHLLTRDLLCFVRDTSPTVDEFLDRFGGPGGSVFDTLRKLGAIVNDDGHVRLHPAHFSKTGKFFDWGNRRIYLDRDVVDLLCSKRNDEHVRNDSEP